MGAVPDPPKQLSFGAIVREHILPYNTLFAISGVLAFVLGLISPALVIAFGASLLAVNVVLIVANLRKARLVSWASQSPVDSAITKRLVLGIWPTAESRLRTSGLFWVFFVTGSAVVLYGATGALDKGWAAFRASREIASIAASASRDAPRVLVLPFSSDTAANDKSASLFARGIHDDIIAGLSRFSSVRVIGRNTSASVSATRVDNDSLKKQYSVNYLVSGRFRVREDVYRLDVELVETGTGTTVWAEPLTGPVADIVNVGEEVVRKVVGRTAVQIMHTELRASRASRSGTFSAYQFTLQARYLWGKPNRESLQQARSMLRKAIEVDPSYAPAHAYLAFTQLTAYNNSWADGYARDETLDEMLALASRAIELEPSNATAHAAQAIAYTYLGRHAEALLSAREVLKLNRNAPEALGRVGQVLSFLGEHESAIKILQNAVELDPLGPAQLLNFLSRAYFFVGKYEVAITHARRCLERSNIEPCRETLAAALALAGNAEEAGGVWMKIAEKRGDMEPGILVVRLKRAFKKPSDLERLATGLRQSRQAAHAREQPGSS